MLRHVELQISTPPVQVRDQLKECKMDQIAFKNGVLSARLGGERLGLDFDQEQKNRALHRDAASPA